MDATEHAKLCSSFQTSHRLVMARLLFNYMDYDLASMTVALSIFRAGHVPASFSVSLLRKSKTRV